MINKIPNMLVFWLTILSGCASGQLWVEGEEFTLRTALFQKEAGITTIVLSTGAFSCDFPSFEDPQDQSLALLEITTAACREGSRHVVFELHGAADGGLGRFETDFDGARGLTGEYLAVEEAELQSRQALERSYTTSEVTHVTEVTGWVDVTRSDPELVGTLSFDSVQGRFAAESCDVGAQLFDVLEVSPVASCP
jgi:hypothetical protein